MRHPPAGRMMRLLELYADQIKALGGYRDERTPPTQTG